MKRGRCGIFEAETSKTFWQIGTSEVGGLGILAGIFVLEFKNILGFWSNKK